MMPQMPEARQFKQCPVCGGNGYITCLFFGLEGYRVHCSFCGYYGPNGKTIDEAWMKVPSREQITVANVSSRSAPCLSGGYGGKAMKWTKDRPTEEGFWFCRYGETMWVYCLTWNDGRLKISGLFPSKSERFIDEIDEFEGFEWAGPIPEPED